jgi:signal transduction histidine kinase/CheY-like chemotaxis protein/PAS domain-containing protein/HPt (histidine-containing phosphotransfer) domain-containing protein
MFSFLGKIKIILRQYAQVLFVAIAFALMVISSYLYVSDIERKNLQKNIKDAISHAETSIMAALLEPESNLAVIAQTICGMILRGDSVETIQGYVLYINNFLQNNEGNHLTGAAGFYGIFDVYGMIFTAGDPHCIPEEDYALQDCPWYQNAIEADGGIGITQPHVDLVSGEGSITFSRRIFDENGIALGIVCLDINIDYIRELANNTYFSDKSFGFLLNEHLEIIAHPDPSVLGMALQDVNIGIAASDAELRRYGSVSEFKATNYLGVESVLYIEKLFNGWYMGIITPEDLYYQRTRDLAMILIMLGIIFSGVLITILLRISAEKNKADERVRVMFDATPLCANFWDNNIKNIECNQEAVKLFGLANKNEYISRFFELSPEYQPDGRLSGEKAVELVRKAFAEGYIRVEWMHQKLNGEPIPCEVILVRIKYKDDFIVAGYTRDLRELKSAITDINESNQSFSILENILNSLDASIYVVVPHSGEILFVNDYMKEHFSIKDDCIGKLCYKTFLTGMYGICDFCPCYKLDEDPYGTVVWEMRNPITDRIYRNTTQYIEWTDGRIVQIQHSVDITELITVKEQAIQANKDKSNFLAKMSHEIRTPMNAILGITEIQLQKKELEPELQEALDRIYNSGYLLLGIINDILDLSKIEAGKLELASVEYEVANLINDAIHLSVMRFDSKPIEFNLEVDENIPSVLLGDDLRIKQILNNLLSNAFKYTKEGKVSLSVSFEKCDSDSVIALVLQVKDTGLGMTPGQVDKLFDEYTRFNMETNRTVEGAGLGMSIAKHLINLMNGKISVESEFGKGSAFTVWLPQEIIDANMLGKDVVEYLKKFHLGRATQMKKTSQIVREYMPYGRVLVVDDVETNLYVARGLMAPYGLSVETSSSGYEAIDKIKSGASYDVIFMDHFMPKMDGMETAQIIREMGYRQPIIALTANALAGQAEIFMENGFEGYISKPIDIRQLNVALNKYVRDKYPAEIIDAARKQAIIMTKRSDLQPATDAELKVIFVRDAEKAITSLEAINKNNYRRADDLRTFVLTIHAMKSALANIGEVMLSTVALNLEQAGRENNTAAIMAGTPVFLDSLQVLIEKIKSQNEDNGTVSEVTDDERKNLCEKLLVIEKACTAYDEITANDVLTGLRQRKWPREVKELLDNIAGNLLHSDFIQAEKSAHEYIDNQVLK